MLDDAFRQKGPDQFPRGIDNQAVDANPSELSGSTSVQRPVWEKFVTNTVAQENNQAAVRAENDQIRSAMRMGETWKGADGKLLRKVGRQSEMLDAEAFTDHPVAGPEARKSLWDREVRTWRKDAQDAAFALRDPSFHSGAMTDKEREDALSEGTMLPETDPRHVELKTKLRADDDYRARKAELAQRSFDSEKRARELESTDPESWWSSRGAEAPSQQRAAVVADAKARAGEADIAADSATKELAGIDAKLAQGVRGSEVDALKARRAEIATGQAVFAQEKAKAAEQVRGVQEQAKAEVDKPFFGFSDAFSGIWDAVKGLGTTAPAAFYQLTEGLERPDKYSDSAKSAFAEADAYTKAMQAKNAQPGATDVGSAFREAGGSLGFSLGSMAAAIPASMAGAEAGAAIGASIGAGAGAPAGGVGAVPGAAAGGGIGGTIGGISAGMAASATAAYRMAGASFLNEAFQQLNAESQRKNGRTMNEEEMASAYQNLLPIAQNTALWEAGPEAVGNAVTMGAGKIVFGLGKPLLAKFGSSALGKAAVVAGDLATELGTETLTQVEQSADQKKMEAVLAGQDPSAISADWSAGGMVDAFKEVAPQTLAMMALMGGAGGVVKTGAMAVDRLRNDPAVSPDIESEAVATELAALDPEADPPSPDEIANGVMIAPASPAEGILIERELAQVEAEDGDILARAEQDFEQAKQSGDKNLIAMAESDVETIRASGGRAPLVRAVLKIAGGMQADDLTDAERNAVGIAKSDSGEFSAMDDKELEDAGISTRMVDVGADGSLILTDGALKKVGEVSPRARGLVKMTEAQAIQKAKERAAQISTDTQNGTQGDPAAEVFPPSEDGGVVPSHETNAAVGTSVTPTPQPNDQQATTDRNPATGEGTGPGSVIHESDPGPGGSSDNNGNIGYAGGENDGQLLGGDQGLPVAGKAAAAPVDDSSHRASLQMSPEERRKDEKAIQRKLMEASLETDDKDEQFRRAGYQQVDGFWVHPHVDPAWIAGLKPETKARLKEGGIKFFDPEHESGGRMVSFNDGTRGMGVKTNADIGHSAYSKDITVLHELGHHVWQKDLTDQQREEFAKGGIRTEHGKEVASGKGRGETYNSSIAGGVNSVAEEDFAQHFAENGGDLPKTLSTPKSTSSAAPPAKYQPGKAALIAAKLRFAKAKKRLKDRLVEGKERAVTRPDGITINPKQIIDEAIARGMTDEQAADYFDLVLDEEVRHLAQYDAARALYRANGGTGDFLPWMESHYAAIWQSDFIATGKDTIIRDLYANSQAEWDAMTDGAKALEAIRMMSQGDSVTEQGKLWANISESLKQAITAALAALKQFADIASPSLKSEITNLENALKQLNQSRPGDSKTGGKKPAPGKTGDGTGKAPQTERDSGVAGDRGAESERRDGAGSPLLVGSRVEFTKNGKKGTGVIAIIKGENVAVRPDDNPGIAVGVDVADVRVIQPPSASTPEAKTNTNTKKADEKDQRQGQGRQEGLLTPATSGEQSPVADVLAAIDDELAKGMEGLFAAEFPEQNREYLAAVESGDMETAQRMVDEAAKAAGYDQKAYQGVGSNFTEFSKDKLTRTGWGFGFHFAKSKNLAKSYADQYDRRGGSGKVVGVFLKVQNPISADDYLKGQRGLDGSFLEDEAETNKLKELGYDGVEYQHSRHGFNSNEDMTSIVAFDPAQIKSADPVTRDAAGNVIPLSQRFNPASDSILYAANLPDAFTQPIPQDRQAILISTVGKYIAAGVNTPEGLAERLRGTLEGKLVPFSQSLWGLFKSSGVAGPWEPNWAGIYASTNQDAVIPAVETVTAPAAENRVTPSLGITGKAIWQGWKALTGVNVDPRTVVEARDVNNGGIYGWVNDELMRLQKTKSGRNWIATMTPATKNEIDGLHESIDRGALQVEVRRITGAGGEWSSEDAGALVQVIHQATGQPIAEFLETPEGKAWQKRMDVAVAKATTQEDPAELTPANKPQGERIPTPPAETPAEAAAEVKGEMVNPANRRPAKEIRLEIIQRVESEIEKIPEIKSAFSQPKTKGGKRVLNGRIANIDTLFSIVEKGMGWDIHAGLTPDSKNFVANVEGNTAALQKKAPYYMMLHVTGQKPTTIEFSIPGDGTFKLIKDRGVLEEFLGRVKSMPITSGTQPPKSKPFRAWYENGNLHISLAGIESAQDPELRKKLVEKFGEKAVTDGENLALSQAGVTREELNGEAPAPVEEAPAAPAEPKPASKPKKQKGPSRMDLLSNYFTPGKVVDGYGGKDRVIEFKAGEDQQWEVKVIRLDEEGARERTHSTEPSNKELIRAWQAKDEQPSAEKKSPSQVAKKNASAKLQESAKAPSRIEDFGEKILGAKKDLWGRFKHAIEQDLPGDVADMAISKIFPEPDYESAIAQGIPADSLASYKAIRDAIPSKPRKGYKLERWVTVVRGIHPLMQKLATGENLSGTEIEAVSKLLRGGSLGDKINFYKDLGFPAFQKADDWRIIDGVSMFFENGVKLENPIVKTVGSFKGRFTDIDSTKPERQGYIEVLDRVRDRIIKQMEQPSEKKDRATDFSIYSDRLTKDVFIGKKAVNGVIRLKTGFSNSKFAQQYLEDNREQLEEQWNGMKAKPDYRRQVNAPRQGPVRRDGDATPEQFQDAFGFRGVQFGNWVEGDRRQVDINEAFDAFMDLAEALGIPPRAVSLDGSLGLAFGARGHAGAAAHYEPGQVVINLTKMSGPGSLAHEWFHAFDNYFARLDATGETKAKSLDAFATTGKSAPKNMRPEVWQAFKNIRAVLAAGPFAERSKKLDDAKSKPYYQTTIEKAARAFERYTVDRLEGEEISNDYLVNIVKDFDPALPTEDEMNAGIREAFDKLFGIIDAVQTDDGVMLRSSDLPPTRKIIKINRELSENTRDLQRRFNKNIASGKLASFGNEKVRKQLDIVDAQYEHERVRKENKDAETEGLRRFKESREAVEEKLLKAAAGEGGFVDAADAMAFQRLIEQKVYEAGDDINQHEENGRLMLALRMQRADVARVMQIGYDRNMTPEQRLQKAFAEAIYAPTGKVERYARTLPKSEQLDYMAKSMRERLEKIEKELAKLGVTLGQVTGKNRDLQLANSKLMKDINKLRNVLEQGIIKMVQKGASMTDIKRRYGVIGFDQAQDVIQKAREELFAKINEMAKSGMSRDQIRDALKDGLKSSPLASDSGMTPDEIWKMIEEDFGLPKEIPAQPITRTPRKKLEKAAESNPLTSDWSRPIFKKGMDEFEFDTKDREGIMQRVEVIRGLAGALGKIDSLTGENRAKAEAQIKEIDQILSKYGTDAKGIFNAAQNIEDYGFDVTDVAQVAAVSRAISMIDADIVDKASEWLYFSMLSGLQTMMVNATAIVPAAWETTVGRGFESAINLFFKDPMSAQLGESKYILKAIRPALTRAWSNAQTAFVAQHPMFDRDVLAQEIDWERVMGGKGYRTGGSISGKWGDRIRIPMRILTATDDFNTTLMACVEVGTFAARIAKAKGMKPGSPEFNAFIEKEVNEAGSFSYVLATEKAKSAIFSNPLPGQHDPVTGKKVPVNDLGDAAGYLAGKITDTFSKEHDNLFVKTTFAAMRIAFFPFQRTPFNILRKGVRYTLNPFSLFDIGLGIAQNSRTADGKWEWNAKGRNPELIRRMAMQMQGAMLMLLVAGLAEGDDDDQDKPIVITGSAPFSPRGQAEREAGARSGLGPYRISFRRKDGSERFGFSYGRLEPLATTLAASVDIMKSIKRTLRGGGDASDAASAAMGGFVAQAQDKSFLRGVGDFTELVTNALAEPDLKDNRKMQQFLAGRVAMVMPNIIRQPIRESDENFRERSAGFMQELLYQTVPTGKKPAKVDPYGQPVTKPGTALGRTVDVTDAGTDTVHPMDRMLLKFRDKHPDKAWFPSVVNSAEFTNRKTGKSEKMNPEQLSEFKRMAGLRLDAALKTARLNLANPTERDIEAAKELVQKSRSDAKKLLSFKYSR